MITTLRSMIDTQQQLKAYGTSEGVQKAWDSRGRGRAALKEAGFIRYHKDSGGLQSFKHKVNPEHTIHLFSSDKSWMHERPNGRTTHGSGEGSLVKHIKNYLPKFQSKGE